MNKKGFTLIELIAVIALIAIIAVIAIPNVTKMVNTSKKETFLTNARTMITNAKYRNKLEKYDSLFETVGSCRIITASNLGVDLKDDPDNNTYDLDNSKVKVCLEDGTFVYYVKTISIASGDKLPRGVYNNTTDENYVLEANLSNDSVIDIE